MNSFMHGFRFYFNPDTLGTILGVFAVITLSAIVFGVIVGTMIFFIDRIQD
jgi:hypothetical protein